MSSLTINCIHYTVGYLKMFIMYLYYIDHNKLKSWSFKKLVENV